MAEHIIRFRGGWECHASIPGFEQFHRVTLPIAWPAGLEGAVRLSRWFQRPTLDPSSERLFLRLDDVAGLRRARINDQELVHGPLEARSLVVALDDLTVRRNVLVLDAEVRPSGEDPTKSAAWGSIALVIRPITAGPLAVDLLGERGDFA